MALHRSWFRLYTSGILRFITLAGEKFEIWLVNIYRASASKFIALPIHALPDFVKFHRRRLSADSSLCSSNLTRRVFNVANSSVARAIYLFTPVVAVSSEVDSTVPRFIVSKHRRSTNARARRHHRDPIEQPLTFNRRSTLRCKPCGNEESKRRNVLPN